MKYPTGNSISNGVTTVECHKQVRSWRLLRSLIKLLIPTCNSTFFTSSSSSSSSSSSLITGTIFGHRHGKASLCIQSHPNSPTPLLLLQVPVPTSILAKHMRGGTLRIVLHSAITHRRASSTSRSSTLLSSPLWTVSCNGRKHGCALKRRPSTVDMEVLRMMREVVAGAGVLNVGKDDDDDDGDDEVMYLRAYFQRVRLSEYSESFRLIDPQGSIGEELSISFIGFTSH